MNISVPLLKIYSTNIFNIAPFVNGLSEDNWNSWDVRQKNFNVHKNTKTYPLKWSEESNENTYKIFSRDKESSINRILHSEVSKLEKFYEGTCINILFVKLLPYTDIVSHTDKNMLLNVHRIHLPIITNKNVDFYINYKKYNLKQGIFYELNNSLPHWVENNSSFDRVHLILDILPHNKNIKLIEYTENKKKIGVMCKNKVLVS